MAGMRPNVLEPHRRAVGPQWCATDIDEIYSRASLGEHVAASVALSSALAMARVFTPALSDFSPTHRPLFSVFLMTASELRSLGRGAAA